MSEPAEIDRLIEEGLSLYGTGDLDGALLAWEQALATDPDNPMANSYVDYVRMNYELLTRGDPEVVEGNTAPFGIEETPEYQIEIAPGQEPPAPASAPVAVADALDEGWFTEESPAAPSHGIEPEAPLIPPPAPVREPSVIVSLELEAEEPPGINFEDSTREYDNGLRAPAADFQQEEHTGGFQSEGTPVGFAAQITDVRKRDLGFVKPVAPQPEIEAPDLELGAAGSGGNEYEARGGLHKPATRDLPGAPRLPAVAVNPMDIAVTYEPTRELDREQTLQFAPARGFHDDPMVSAPTRELGIRPMGRPLTNSDEATTRESDVRAIRESANAQSLDEGTRHDIVLPFDPIDARSAQILDEIDAEAPPGESNEDRPRRRISTLLDRAGAWSAHGDLEKAVTAIDLALSEDPNSALAQKLIHRNRETIMSVFQAYLGDLDRQPQLARPLHELASAPISPRAAFLLSRIDGGLSIDEILDVSGMPRLEAYRHLCQLFLRGILR